MNGVNYDYNQIPNNPQPQAVNNFQLNAPYQPIYQVNTNPQNYNPYSLNVFHNPQNYHNNQGPQLYGEPVYNPVHARVDFNTQLQQNMQNMNSNFQGISQNQNLVQPMYEEAYAKFGNKRINEVLGELDLTAQQYNLVYNQLMIWFCYNASEFKSFDFENERWISLPNPSGFKLMEYFRVAQLPDYSFIITGGSESDNYSSMTLLFDNCQFIRKSDMNSSRRAHSSIYNDGFVYVFGGLRNNVTIRECERYSIDNDRWEPIASLSLERSLTSVCNFSNDRIYIFGGYTTFGDKDLNIIEEFNTFTLSMRVLPFKLHQIMETPIVTQINDKEVLIFGGYNDNDGDINSVTAMNMETGKNAVVKKLKDIGWSVYPSFFIKNTFFLFVTGEESNTPEIKKINI